MTRLATHAFAFDLSWWYSDPPPRDKRKSRDINPDSDLPIRYLGGLALEYDVVARYTTGYHVGGRHNGEGYFAPFHVFFDYTRQQVDSLPSLQVLANLHPLEEMTKASFSAKSVAPT
ncbi:MAG: hypothetical protein ACC628_25390 [Pirellulaceae bacterium]